MPKLDSSASKEEKRERVKEEMDKFSRGDLHSGSKHGPRVKSRSQAIAISLSESGQGRKNKRTPSRGGRR
jgi:hypothetical protein